MWNPPGTGRSDENNLLDGAKEDDEARHNSFVGTAEYVSPEVLANDPATPAVDLWAVGCIIYHMLSGKVPFRGQSDYLTFQEILVHCDGTKPLEFPMVMPEAAVALIKKLLVREPSKRLGAGVPGTDNDYTALKVK